MWHAFTCMWMDFIFFAGLVNLQHFIRDSFAICGFGFHRQVWHYERWRVVLQLKFLFLKQKDKHINSFLNNLLAQWLRSSREKRKKPLILRRNWLIFTVRWAWRTCQHVLVNDVSGPVEAHTTQILCIQKPVQKLLYSMTFYYKLPEKYRQEGSFARVL